MEPAYGEGRHLTDRDKINTGWMYRIRPVAGGRDKAAGYRCYW